MKQLLHTLFGVYLEKPQSYQPIQPCKTVKKNYNERLYSYNELVQNISEQTKRFKLK